MRAMGCSPAPLTGCNERGGESAVPRPRHWFWGVVAQSWPIYGEVMLASMLGNLFAQFAWRI
jgi:ABC-type bacteriocin/lantibiotic exporter with double-glycine peptidase domain